jgi:transposase
MKLKRSRLNPEQTQRLLEHFVAGTPARTAAALVGVNRNTATYFYHRLRKLIAVRLESVSPLRRCGVRKNSESGPDDTNEAVTDSGKNNRTTVFAMLKHGGKVFATMVPHTPRNALRPLRQAGFEPQSIARDDTLDVYDLLDVLGHRRPRVKRIGRAVRSRVPIGGVENFWSQARRNLLRYNGVPAQHFLLFVKECEWRFNYGSPTQLLETLDRWISEES